MELSCPSFHKCSESLERDGGYSSNDNSYSEERMSFCYLGSEGSLPLVLSMGATITLTQDPTCALDPSLSDCVLASLSKPILDIAVYSQTLLIALTEDGLFGVSTRTLSKDDRGVLLLRGSFCGLAVQAPNSDCPLILSTSSSPECTSLLVIDITGDVHCQRIPISLLPSDVLPFSEVSSISVDEYSHDVFISDRGLHKVIKLNLLNYSCFQFCNFLHDESILACLALSDRILIVVQNDEETAVNMFDTAGNLQNCKQTWNGGKRVKLGLMNEDPAILIDGKIEKIVLDCM